MNKKEITIMLKAKIAKDVYKRLRPLIERRSSTLKSGYEICLHLPSFINIAIDDKFKIEENELTYRFYNRKIVVSVWKASDVPAQITVYDE